MSLFTNEITEYVEIYKESTKKTMRISEFSKAIGYKSYETQSEYVKSIVWVYAIKKMEIQNYKISFIIVA